MILDRRDPEYREQREARQGNLVGELAAGRIGADAFRVALAVIGFPANEIEDLLAEHRPFRTVGQVAEGFVSGLPEKWRNG